MVLASQPGPELLDCPDHRIDLASQIRLHITQPPDCFPQSDGTNDQEVHVATRHRAPGCHRPEHEGGSDAPLSQGALEHGDQTLRLQENLTQGGEEWVPFVGAKVPSIAIPAVGEQVGLHQVIDFPLDSAGSQAGKAYQLAEIKLAVR